MNQNNQITIAKLRHQVLKTIRSHFDDQGFIEIDAPVMIEANAVEAFIDPLSLQVCDPDGHKGQAYLSTSPEIHMKRLLSHGAEKIYSLGPVFRDRERSPKHLTEFTMLEWYRAGSDLSEIEADCALIFSSLHSALERHNLARTEFDFHTPMDRLCVAEAWEKYAHIDLEACLSQIATGDQNALVRKITSMGESLRENADFDDAFAHIMLKRVEPAIGQKRPCVLYDWPAQTAALAGLVPNNPLFAQRFEIYCGGFELANAFFELTDHAEQRARFEEANSIRLALGRDILPMPEAFLSDLRRMPKASGIAVGVDRVIALMTGNSDLRTIKCLSN
jgi:lysyl-tRNA synthetase class 2